MTVLDAFGWAMTAAPYIPAFAVLSVLTGAVYAAWHTARAWRRRRAERAEAARVAQADQRLGNRLHHTPTRPGPLDHTYRQLEQTYQMPAWEEQQ
jgi:threonine/homoserine/homoserine lactone efflux protein